MQAYFSTYLTAQDRNKLWPHITIQNKVTAYKALVTHTLLDPKFVPFTIRAQGLSVWKYLNGPWEHMSDHLFT